MKQLSTIIPRTDVGLAAKRTHRDRIIIDDRHIVGEATVHVTDAMEFGRKYARHEGNEAGTDQRLEQIFAAIEMRDNHIFTVMSSRERYM